MTLFGPAVHKIKQLKAEQIPSVSKLTLVTIQADLGNDCQVTMEAQLGLIGGTMGLLTGFSILSGVEIIYYLLRFILPFNQCTMHMIS